MAELLAHCAGLPERAFAAGETLIAEGQETGGTLYVLVEGEVEIVKDGMPLVTVSEPGAVFGEMALLLDGAYTATVRAVTASRVRVASDGDDFLDGTPAAMRAVARLLARRLELAMRYLVDLSRQFAGHPASLEMVHEVIHQLGHHQETDEVCEPGSDREREPNY